MMSTTVLEALQNAQINFETIGRMGASRNQMIYLIAMDQLKNGIEALENGKSPNDIIQEHVFGGVDTGGGD